MPLRIDPESWITEHPADPVPGSVDAAEEDRLMREARQVLERGF